MNDRVHGTNLSCIDGGPRICFTVAVEEYKSFPVRSISLAPLATSQTDDVRKKHTVYVQRLDPTSRPVADLSHLDIYLPVRKIATADSLHWWCRYARLRYL